MRPLFELVLPTMFIYASSFSAVQSVAQEKGTFVNHVELNVEFRWIEPKAVDGLTEEWGRAIDCGKGKWYPHKKSVLSASDIQTIRMIESYSTGRPRYRYCLSFTFKESAIQKLINACGDGSAKRLACIVLNERGKNVRTSPFLTYSDFDKNAPGEFLAPSTGSTTKEITDQVLESTKFKGPVPFEASSWRKPQ